MTDHPIQALGTMLRNSAKPPERLTWCQFLQRRGVTSDSYNAMTEAEQRLLTEAWLGQALPLPPININALDPDDPYGVDDVIDLDREREIRAGLHYEKPSGS